MAVKQESMLVAPTPDGSGNVLPELWGVKALSSPYNSQNFIFKDSGTRIGLHDSYPITSLYSSAPVLVIRWTSIATTGNIVWDFEYRVVDIGESLDQAGTQEAGLTVTDAALGTARSYQEATIALSAANFAKERLLQFTLFRDGADAADTLAADGVLWNLMFRFDDGS